MALLRISISLSHAGMGRVKVVDLPEVEKVFPPVEQHVYIRNKVYKVRKMAGQDPAAGGPTQNINVGGSAAGVAQIAGNSNTVTATGRISSDMSEDVLKALLAIQTAVSAHPAARVLTDAAVQEAKKPQADKSAIGAQLKSALDIAKTGLGWAEIAKTLAPSIEAAANWLGGEWTHLLTP
jgi:hypothetical protein